ncbi:MAG: maleylacetoacetate isomerase [Alphaproteobacteria bacterium]
MKPETKSSKDSTLYSYFRSSTSYRLRIGLNLKRVTYNTVPVNLREGEHLQPQFRAINPQGLVPALSLPSGRTLSQSMAALEYLEETVPTPSFLPGDTSQRARIRELANIIAIDIHPINNLRVLKYLSNNLNISEDDKNAWIKHWIYEGFEVLENHLQEFSQWGKYTCGSQVTLADICLIPQVYNAERFGCDMSRFPRIRDVTAACMELSAFADARPENQPDAL